MFNAHSTLRCTYSFKCGAQLQLAASPYRCLCASVSIYEGPQYQEVSPRAPLQQQQLSLHRLLHLQVYVHSRRVSRAAALQQQQLLLHWCCSSKQLVQQQLELKANVRRNLCLLLLLLPLLPERHHRRAAACRQQQQQLLLPSLLLLHPLLH